MPFLFHGTRSNIQLYGAMWHYFTLHDAIWHLFIYIKLHFLKTSVDKRIDDYIINKTTTTNTTFKLNDLGAWADATPTSKTAKDELQ